MPLVCNVFHRVERRRARSQPPGVLPCHRERLVAADAARAAWSSADHRRTAKTQPPRNGTPTTRPDIPPRHRERLEDPEAKRSVRASECDQLRAQKTSTPLETPNNRPDSPPGRTERHADPEAGHQLPVGEDDQRRKKYNQTQREPLSQAVTSVVVNGVRLEVCAAHMREECHDCCMSFTMVNDVARGTSHSVGLINRRSMGHFAMAQQPSSPIVLPGSHGSDTAKIMTAGVFIDVCSAHHREQFRACCLNFTKINQTKSSIEAARRRTEKIPPGLKTVVIDGITLGVCAAHGRDKCHICKLSFIAANEKAKSDDCPVTPGVSKTRISEAPEVRTAHSNEMCSPKNATSVKGEERDQVAQLQSWFRDIQLEVPRTCKSSTKTKGRSKVPGIAMIVVEGLELEVCATHHREECTDCSMSFILTNDMVRSSAPGS